MRVVQRSGWRVRWAWLGLRVGDPRFAHRGEARTVDQHYESRISLAAR